jgi:hypothetical protein
MSRGVSDAESVAFNVGWVRGVVEEVRWTFAISICRLRTKALPVSDGGRVWLVI